MSTVVRRCFAATPARPADATWHAIVDLLTGGRAGAARDELLSVLGAAASVITDQAPRDVPIVVTCEGSRTRVYCLYDDDAIEASDANEDALGFDPLAGDWAVSLPCPADDLDWIGADLARRSARITARSMEDNAPAAGGDAASGAAAAMTIDVKGFLGS